MPNDSTPAFPCLNGFFISLPLFEKASCRTCDDEGNACMYGSLKHVGVQARWVSKTTPATEIQQTRCVNA
jgi:hypothetical protein